MHNFCPEPPYEDDVVIQWSASSENEIYNYKYNFKVKYPLEYFVPKERERDKVSATGLVDRRHSHAPCLIQIQNKLLASLDIVVWFRLPQARNFPLPLRSTPFPNIISWLLHRRRLPLELLRKMTRPSRFRQ